jgi:hypothetical protein
MVFSPNSLRLTSFGRWLGSKLVRAGLLATMTPIRPRTKVLDMRRHFQMAVTNVVKHGDTDIFPFPIENLILRDQYDEVVNLLVHIYENFDAFLASDPPTHEASLVPVGYTGFRWGSQLDPVWNAYFVGCVVALAESIEASRIPVSEGRVYSYRYKPDRTQGNLFDRDLGWRQFMLNSNERAATAKYVVVCDISEFYPRIAHHRLENALRQIDPDSIVTNHILRFLAKFSGERSFGMPVGGPAARILSELVLDQIDKLLRGNGTQFVRFADDYHIFCDTLERAYSDLIFLSEKLYRNQGLSLQKSKTRILSSSEFVATNPVSSGDAKRSKATAEESEADPPSAASQLMGLSIRFDPYSVTAEEDYEALRNEISRIDIIGLLQAELSKARVHSAITRQVTSAIRFLDPKVRDDAVRTLLENAELLYPIFPTVMMVTASLFDELDKDVQEQACSTIRKLIRDRSHITAIELNLAFALRVLAKQKSAEHEDILQQLFLRSTSTMVRRDVILAMARWSAAYWLGDLKNSFRTLPDSARRAFIIASFTLKDEGRHWREHIEPELSGFEKIVLAWTRAKVQQSGWSIPL